MARHWRRRASLRLQWAFSRRLRHVRVALVATCSGLVAFLPSPPLHPLGIASSARLRADANDDTGQVAWQYRSDADLRWYARITLDPVVIREGAGSDFEGLSDDEKRDLATYLKVRFSAQLQEFSRRPHLPLLQGLRMRVTLLGARKSTPVLDTLSRFDVLAGPYNAVRAANGREGALTGSVSFAVEIFDESTGELLRAYVSRTYPNAWNLPAGIGALSAACVGIDKGAEALASVLARG